MCALDIGSHSVKLVAARRRAGRVQLDAVALAVVPVETMHGHLVRDPVPVAQAIRRAIRSARHRGRDVLTAIPAPAVMVRRLRLRAGPGESLDAALLRELAALVPGSLDQAVLDYQRTGAAAEDGAVPVLAVAARRDLVQSYTAAVRAAGLEPRLVDVDAFAIDRVRRRTGNMGEDAASPVVVIHVGARYAALAVVRDGDAPDVVGDVPVAADGDPGVLAHAVGGALELAGVEPARLALLSGGRAAAPGIAGAVSARLGCVARVLDPFAHMALGARLRRPPAGGGAAFTVAVGLILRGAEEGV